MNKNSITIPIIPIDQTTNDEIDLYLNSLPKKTTIKMLKEDDVISVIRDCINKPKGIVPNSVYNLIPDIKF